MAKAVAVLFAFVVIWGGMAHACDGTHHAHGVEAVSHTATGGEAIAAHHDDDSLAPEQQAHKSVHPCCADLQCHIGAAILCSVAAAAPPRTEAKRLGISNYGHEISQGSPLDRPPRANVQI